MTMFLDHVLSSACSYVLDIEHHQFPNNDIDRLLALVSWLCYFMSDKTELLLILK